MGVIGSCSEGLSTKVLPQAIAIGNIQSGIIAGKLKGVMPTHTPMGWRIAYTSTPPATCSRCSPIWMVPTEHECSTTSRPRKTSPSASASVLPCSWVRHSASFFMSRRMSSWSLSITRTRVPTEALRQVL